MLDGLQFADLLAGLEIQLLAGSDFVARGNHHDVALLAHVQVLLLEDDIDHLIGRHVLQDEGRRARHGVADHRIQAKFLSHQFQEGTDVAVLVVDTDAWSLVTGLRSLHQLVRVLDNALDLDDELIVALIGVVLPQAMRHDGHPYIVAERPGFDGSHGRAKIGYIKLASQILRNAGLQKVDNQALALLTDVYAGAGVVQVDDDSRLAILAATERDILQGVALANGSLRRELRDALGQRTNRRDGGKQNIKRFTVQARRIGHAPRQIQDDACATANLDNVGALQVAFLEGHAGLAQTIRG